MPWIKGQKAWNNKRMVIICKRCFCTYEKPPSQAKNSKYCSRLCQNRAQSDALDRNGENNPMWSGDNATYGAIHQWHLKNWHKTNVCIHCGKYKKTDWALKKGEPMIRDDKTKWLELCRSCHSIYDEKIKNIPKNHKRHNTIKPRNCLWCDNEYIRSAGSIEQKYCSRHCYMKYRNSTLKQP